MTMRFERFGFSHHVLRTRSLKDSRLLLKAALRLLKVKRSKTTAAPAQQSMVMHLRPTHRPQVREAPQLRLSPRTPSPENPRPTRALSLWSQRLKRDSKSNYSTASAAFKRDSRRAAFFLTALTFPPVRFC